jgi:selenocysteine-specific elongation factor
VAGGRVLAIAPPRRRKGASTVVAPLLEADASGHLIWLLRQAGYRGLTQSELFGRSALPPKVLTRTLELLGSRGGALLVDRDKRLYLSGEVFEGLQKRALALLAAFHEREPMREGLSREELRQRLSPELDPRIFQRVAQALVDTGKAELDKEVMRLKGRGRTLTVSDEGARARVAAELAAAALAPPTFNELAQKLKFPTQRLQELLKVMVAEGAIIRVSEELHFDAGALGTLQQRLVSYLRENKEISTQVFKEMVGQSRKFVIPLSEYFDREKVTLRVGEKRILRRA